MSLTPEQILTYAGIHVLKKMDLKPADGGLVMPVILDAELAPLEDVLERLVMQGRIEIDRKRQRYALTKSGVQYIGGLIGEAEAIIDEFSELNTLCQECTLYARGASSYAFCLAPQTWADARVECGMRGGDLVVIDDAQENDAIAGQISVIEGTLGQWWFGLNDIALEGSYVWLDGLPLVYSRWALGEPNNFNGKENCAVLYDDSDWNDAACLMLRGFLCEAPAPTP